MQLVLFDIDGTLLSVHGAGKRAMQDAIAEHYGIEDALSEVTMDGKTDQGILREALDRGGLPFSGLETAFLRTYLALLEHELDRFTDSLVLAGVSELLQRLSRDSRFFLGLATGNVAGGARLKLARAGLDRYFSVGGFGCDAEDRTRVVAQAIQRARNLLAPVEIDQVFVIGDTPRDIHHSRAAGARTLAVATGSYSREELVRHQPDFCLTSLENSVEVHRLLGG